MALSKTFATGAILSAADVNQHMAHVVPNSGNPFDTGWVALSPASGLSFNTPPAYRRLGMVLFLRGEIASGLVVNATTTIATLPSGTRPARTIRQSPGTTYPDVAATLTITTSGTIQIRLLGSAGVVNLHTSFPIG